MLDTKAVELQKEKVRANEERIRRLKELEQKNYEGMCLTVFAIGGHARRCPVLTLGTVAPHAKQQTKTFLY